MSSIVRPVATEVWDDAHHPSYREVWDRVLPETHERDVELNR